MNDGTAGNSLSGSNEYRFSLKRVHIAALVAAPLLSILVYWLTLPQGAAIAVTTLLFYFGVVG